MPLKRGPPEAAPGPLSRIFTSAATDPFEGGSYGPQVVEFSVPGLAGMPRA